MTGERPPRTPLGTELTWLLGTPVAVGLVAIGGFVAFLSWAWGGGGA